MLVGLTLRDDDNITRALDFKVLSEVEADILLKLLSKFTYSRYYGVIIADTREQLLEEEYAFMSEDYGNTNYKQWGQYNLLVYKTSKNAEKLTLLCKLITDTRTECEILYKLLSHTKKYQVEKLLNSIKC